MKEYNEFALILRQLVYAEVSHIMAYKLTRSRIRSLKREIRKTIVLEVKRKGLQEPEIGWKKYLKKLVDPAIDDMIARKKESKNGKR